MSQMSEVAFASSLPLSIFHHNEQRHNRRSGICMSASGQGKVSKIPRRAVVWFRDGDLRIENHPGLEAAIRLMPEAVAPLLVCTPSTPLQTLEAAKRLQAELNQRGSHLVLRFAFDEATGVVSFLREYEADKVLVQMDVEHETFSVVSKVQSLAQGLTEVETWSTGLFDCDNIEAWTDLPDEFPQFRRWSKRLNKSVPRHAGGKQHTMYPGTGLAEQDFPLSDVARKVLEAQGLSEERRRFDTEFEKDQAYVRTIKVNPEVEQFGEFTLETILKSSDSYEYPDIGRSLAEVLRQGALSPKRIHEVVCEYEKSNGRLWRPFYRDGAKQILNFLEAKEFSTLLARRDIALKRTVDGEHRAKFWKWKGYLMRYVEEGRNHAGNGKPPLLLVHGFGASSQHFRRSIRELKKRFHVYAVDLVGFGRSEKPPTQYTQDLWECMIWDFVEKVIQKPVFVAGNSIGGYLACAFGADSYPSLCKGVCLINSAGKLEDLDSPQQAIPRKDSPFQLLMKNSVSARMMAANFLLKSLQGRIDKTLKFVYPTNPEAADEQLSREIRRNSTDYGAASVLASGLVLPPPRSLSQLLQKYEGPLLVFQGELDPLNNAKERANTIQKQYPQARVVRVNAGHCPHEEDAITFVREIGDWMDSLCVRSEDKEAIRSECR